jgi:hypothetical protein
MITPVWAVGLLLEDLERPLLPCSTPLMTPEGQLSDWLVMTCWYGSRVAPRTHSCHTRVTVRKLWPEPRPPPVLKASGAQRRYKVDPQDLP